MDRASTWSCGLNRAAIENVELGTELAHRLGCGGCRPRRSGVFEKRGAAEEGVDVYSSFEELGKKFDVK